MKLMPLPMLSLLSIVIFLSGCAAQTKTVAFAPVMTEMQTDQNDAGKLENMSPAALLEKGVRYLQEGNIPLAKLHLLKALSLEPGNVEILQRVGDLFLQLEEWDEARTIFAAVLEKNPEDLQVLLGLGKLNRLKGDCPEAEKFLIRAQGIATDNAEVLTELAICYDTTQRGSEAAALYRRVTDILPRDSSAFNNLGFHYLIQGDYPQAVAALQIARQVKPQDRLIKNNLAAAHILSGNESRGLAIFENSLGRAGAFNNVGYIYMIQGQWHKAEVAFLHALELNPRYYVKAAKNLEYLRIRLARQENGRKILQKVESVQ